LPRVVMAVSRKSRLREKKLEGRQRGENQSFLSFGFQVAVDLRERAKHERGGGEGSNKRVPSIYCSDGIEAIRRSARVIGERGKEPPPLLL